MSTPLGGGHIIFAFSAVRRPTWFPDILGNSSYPIFTKFGGNTLASHLCGRGSIPVMAVSGKAGSCLPLVGSLQYRTLANYMYWFPLPFQLPVVI